MATCYHCVNIAKVHFVADIDVKVFFDNINHKKLKLCSKTEKLSNPRGGAPQGGILSPLLANTVLNEFDW
ncbi:MAG: hypothetical protein ACRC3I_12090 [Cetobacterium sp.]